MRFVIIFLIVCVCGTFATAQKKMRAKQEVEKHKQKMKATERLLNASSLKAKNTLSNLNFLSTQIEFKKEYLALIKVQIDSLSKTILRNDSSISVVESQLDGLIDEYKKVVMITYKSSDHYQKLQFLFSAKDLTQFRARLYYFNYYSKYRKKQIEQIRHLREQLLLYRFELENEREELTFLQKEKTSEKEKVKGLQEKEKDVYLMLKKSKGGLEKIKKEQQRSYYQKLSFLKKLEVEEAKRELEKEKAKKLKEDRLKKETLNKKIETKKKEENKKKSFAYQRYRLHLPFEEAEGKIVISSKLLSFDYDDTEMKFIVKSNAKIKSVFSGKVVSISDLRGSGYLVVVQHGDYMTSYTNLSYVKVKKGQLVAKDQVLGIVATVGQGATIVKFSIYKNNQYMDLKHWYRVIK